MVSGNSKRRMTVLFAGRVQGVGFRYTTCRVAESFAVTGCVRNLMNGDVEMVAEGAEQELVDFLHEIKGSHVGRCITRDRVNWSAATGEFDSFRILY
jgi:acylphosphatase